MASSLNDEVSEVAMEEGSNADSAATLGRICDGQRRGCEHAGCAWPRSRQCCALSSARTNGMRRASRRGRIRSRCYRRISAATKRLTLQ